MGVGQVSVGASGFLGRSLAHFSQFSAFWGLFGHILCHLGFFYRLFSILDRFCMVFGRFWKGIWRAVSSIFHIFRTNCVCVWKSTKHLRGRMNFQGRLSKKHVNFQKNARKNWWNYMVGKNKGKIHTNTEFGTVLGLSGTGLGGFWNSSGRFWPPHGRFLDVLARTFF